jgi:1-acyl-sn-glycerol-3-phosphate acyltransferase
MRAISSLYRWIRFLLVGGFWILSGYPSMPFGRLKTRDHYLKISPAFGRDLMKALGAKMTFEGLENFDPAKNYVFVGNHQSYADIPLIQAAIGSVGKSAMFMAKKYLFKVPIFGLAISRMGLIPIEGKESKAALKSVLQAIDTVKEGNSLIVFAEGTRSIDGTIAPFKRGAFMLAERMDMPVVPFVIIDNYKIFPRKGFYITPGPCKIIFLPPMERGELNSKEFMAQVEGVVRARYEAEVAQ